VEGWGEEVESGNHGGWWRWLCEKGVDRYDCDAGRGCTRRGDDCDAVKRVEAVCVSC
jgi:hypothetical protein